MTTLSVFLYIARSAALV